jgi:hypothetical protein
MKRQTQNERILNLLNKGRKLTSAQARTYNIMSLSCRVNELRQRGHDISISPYKRRDGRVVVQYHL